METHVERCSTAHGTQPEHADTRPRTQVISQLKRLDTDAVKLALDRLNAADKDIANPVAYLMTCLYNAPDELDAMLGIECERDLPHLTQRYRR